MGYSTRFSLEIKHYSGPEDAENCEHSVPEGSRFCPTCGQPAGWHHIIDDILEVHLGYWDAPVSDLVDENMDQSKWYEHKEDMIRLSKMFPGHLFILSGKGEGSGDIWKEYYLDGKVQVAKAEIVIPEFDPEKMM